MLIGISGKARSGKDTFANIISGHLFDTVGKSFVLMAYAKDMKDRIQRDFDLTYDQLWGDKKENIDERYFNKKTERYWTAREIMQNYGDFYRSIDGDYWVKQLMNKIDDLSFENVIITDLRQRNEVDAVLDRGGVHIRINRNKGRSNINNPNHISETELDNNYKVDFLVDNSEGIKELTDVALNIIPDVIKLINDRRK